MIFLKTCNIYRVPLTITFNQYAYEFPNVMFQESYWCQEHKSDKTQPKRKKNWKYSKKRTAEKKLLVFVFKPPQSNYPRYKPLNK